MRVDERSVSELAGEFVEQAGVLVQQEIQLAKQELGEMAHSTLRAAIFFAVALVALLVAFISLVAFLILGIGWLVGGYLASTAIVFVLVFVAIGALLGWMGKQRLRISMPEQTIESVKEDLEWAKAQLRRIRRF